MTHRCILLTLFIHRRSREHYYRDHDQFVAKQKSSLESLRGEPFDALPDERQTWYLDRWFWPPWRFNDLVGFAEIELETSRTVIGHLYLPKGRITTATKKPLLLQYASASTNFDEDDAASLHTAIVDVARQLQQRVSSRRWRLEFDPGRLKYIGFLSLIAARDEAPNS